MGGVRVEDEDKVDFEYLVGYECLYGKIFFLFLNFFSKGCF